MTSRIKLLPDVLINKIAAGEVIERPASVVKELVENSLDAEATSVSVSVTDGGLTQIDVSDNGFGMTPEDLRLAVQRHATSKLDKPEDLFCIRSFGFRGEALPSITSVSHCAIKSRSRDSAHGYLIEIEGGKKLTEAETGCDYGTYITIRNLFYNTPARRKFLRSASAEVRRILEVMESLSIANPQSEFNFESDGRRLLDLSAVQDKFERAGQLFGTTLQEKFLRGERHSDNLMIEVYLSKPEISRRNRSRVMILVNGRRIESKSLFSALISAYGEFLTSGNYPQGAVFVTIEPSLVDVNVHPAKSEVRFSDERVIYHLLYQLVRETLLSGQAVPGLAKPAGFNRFSGHQRAAHSGLRIEDFGFRNESLLSNPQSPLHNPQSAIPNPQSPISSPQSAIRSLQSLTHFGSNVVAFDLRPFREVGRHIRYYQVANLYIVVVAPDSLLIIDQHAAHERVLYELALRALRDGSTTSQRLLFPINIHLEANDFLTFEREKESIAALGFHLTEFGRRHLQLESVPAALGDKNPETVFLDLLDDFGSITGDEEKRYKKKAASFACRSAIMAGDRLEETAMRALFQNLMASENPYVCPHGRPTVIHISKNELDLKFGRI